MRTIVWCLASLGAMACGCTGLNQYPDAAADAAPASDGRVAQDSGRDAVYVGARCGDGACDGGETCAGCPEDCGACATACRACTDSSTCTPGERCRPRACDGAKACSTIDPPPCAIVTDADGAAHACPAIPAYDQCAADVECGNWRALKCGVPYAPGNRRFCTAPCAAPSDCAPAPAGLSSVRPQCDRDAHQCFLECTGSGTCPYGLTCTAATTDGGVFAYCN